MKRFSVIMAVALAVGLLVTPAAQAQARLRLDTCPVNPYTGAVDCSLLTGTGGASGGTVQPGGTVAVSASGFRANSSVQVYIVCGGDEQLLKTVTTSSSGAIDESVKIPSDMSGSCRIEARGVDANGDTRVVGLALTVGPIANTGVAGVPVYMILALLAVAGGLATVLVKTRGRSETPVG